MKYEVPEIQKRSFTCPYCNVLSTQNWNYASIAYDGRIFNSFSENSKFKIYTSTCDNCDQIHIWINGNMIIPSASNVPVANEYMPNRVKDIYNEARDVFPKSAKAAAALLRLALQHLCVDLGEEGENINNDIKKLVQKGLPIQVQQALDIIRVTGNNAVHPGTMDLDDDTQIAAKLFELLNFIVDRMIIQPKEIENIFNDLPAKYLRAIEDRDKVNV